MISLLALRSARFILIAIVVFVASRTCCRAQAALLLEEPYGLFGALNPTGHNALYFEHICAETPLKLRRCSPGEFGAVIARYQGIAGYDWIAIPLVPYLYSVEDLSRVPVRAGKKQVAALRDKYHEQHLLDLGKKVSAGNLFHGGWKELVGVSYERRMFAFQFATTPEQDDALIAQLNSRPNRTHFHLLYNNCADFARVILNGYFPDVFRRSIMPDAGMTTPKQIAYKLERYAAKHPEVHLRIFEIQQIPGNRRHSSGNKDISESLMTTGYVVPITVLNPYLAAGILADSVIRGHFHLIPKDRPVLTPANLSALTGTTLTGVTGDAQNSQSAGVQASSAATGGRGEE